MCKDGSSTQVVGALKHETISLVCGVQSKPPPITFHWTFNNSGELMNVPSNRFTPVKPLSLITSHWHGSRLNYTLANDMDYGTVACWAKNRIGVQKTPCLFQIIVAGKPYPLQNCTALQSTGPYAYRMGKWYWNPSINLNAPNYVITYPPCRDGMVVAHNSIDPRYCVQQLVFRHTLDQRETERERERDKVFDRAWKRSWN